MKRYGRWLARVAALLAAVLLLGAVAVSADTVQEGYFVLSAVANGQVIIAPERVSYTAGQRVKEALAASGHTFTGLDEGIVTAIDGVAAGFVRGDQSGDYDLSKQASTVTHYCFTTASSAKPSAERQALMTAMADYLAEPVDVQNAAKARYQAAYMGYPNAADADFDKYTKDLSNAIAAYKAGLSSTFTVTFSGHSGKSIQAVNAYGKVYDNQKMGDSLSLPAGTYTFTVADGIYRVSGEITVSGSMAVDADLPTGQWLNTAKFQAASAPDNDGSETKFSENLLATSWSGSTGTVQVPDSISGWAYFYLEHSCETTPTLTALYTNTSGQKVESKNLAFQSYRSGLSGLLLAGAQGNTVTLRLSQTGADGCTQSMDYTLKLDRTPTLSGLTVKNQSGVVQAAEPAFTPLTTAYTYYVNSNTTAVAVAPTAFSADYTVTVNGESLTGGTATVALSGDETVIPVAVSGGGYTTTYDLKLVRAESYSVTISTDADVVLRMYNQNHELLGCDQKIQSGKAYYVYQLVKDKKYTYTAQKDTWYHEEKTFTADGTKTLSVTVQTDDWLTDLAFGTTMDAKKKGSIALTPTFTKDQHSYTAELPDSKNTVCVWANALYGVTAEVLYQTISDKAAGQDKVVKLSCGIEKGTQLPQLLLSNSAYGNTAILRLSQVESGSTYYQDYQITFRKSLSLDDMTVTCGDDSVVLRRTGNEETGYTADVTAYEVTVPAAASSLELTVPVSAKKGRYGDSGNGYVVSVNGEDVTAAGKTTVDLNGTTVTETVTIEVTNRYVPDASTTITVQVQKSAPVYTTVSIAPDGALLAMYEKSTGNRVWPENGVYMLSDGFAYDYLLTKSGYVGQSGTIQVTRDNAGAAVLKLGEQTIATSTDGGRTTAQLTMGLSQAANNTSLDPAIPSSWPSFRGNADNNGAITFKTPIQAENSTLYWAKQIGVSMEGGVNSGGDSVSSPILVDGDLVVYAGNMLYRVDRISGEIKANGQMAGSSSFSINPPAYADGMIFVGLSEGRIQAFDAVTLRSLWIYQDPLGGQPNTNLTIRNGYLYAGFWNSEIKNANFVCLPIDDEDPTRTDEVKTAAWRWTQKGGFYWAGAYVCEDYLLVGTDDGQFDSTSQTSSLLMLDPGTGKLLDRWDGLNGDIRSDICHSGDRFYFVSKGGSFYSMEVTKENGSWKLTDPWTLALGGMSTSTPVVQNGRAYVGVSGNEGQFKPYRGHHIAVIDLSGRSVAYTIATQGYPQTSGLLTTGYADGYNYVYFMDNMTPGKLRVVKDRTGQTSASTMTKEIVGSSTYETAYALFTPMGSHAQYCISSPIADENGVLYFKNDAGYLMAFGPSVEKLEVTEQPTSLTYVEGDSFDPTGMQITAVLSNGSRLDVTKYVKWSEDALTLGQSTVTIRYPLVGYHNASGAGGTMASGVTTTTPTVELTITVKSNSEPATAISGVTVADDTATVRLNGAVQSGWKIFVATYDENGKMIAVTQAAATGNTATATLTGNAVRVKAFVLGTDYQPVMKNWEGTI